jgi:hypothetical protein
VQACRNLSNIIFHGKTPYGITPSVAHITKKEKYATRPKREHHDTTFATCQSSQKQRYHKKNLGACRKTGTGLSAAIFLPVRIFRRGKKDFRFYPLRACKPNDD